MFQVEADGFLFPTVVIIQNSNISKIAGRDILASPEQPDCYTH